MTRLPTLKAGLKLKRSASPAVFTGVMTFVLTLVPCVAVLITMPAPTETLSISNWIHSLQEALGHFKLFELLRAQWVHLIGAIVVSMAAGTFAGYDAWDQAPLVEPFITPNPADPRIYYDEDARLKLRARFKAETGRMAGKGIWLAPYLNLPFLLETRNVMVEAASGHGKSSLVRSYARQMMCRGDHVLLHCNK